MPARLFLLITLLCFHDWPSYAAIVAPDPQCATINDVETAYKTAERYEKGIGVLMDPQIAAACYGRAQQLRGCRDIRRDVVIDGVSVTAIATLCPQANGRWALEPPPSYQLEPKEVARSEHVVRRAN